MHADFSHWQRSYAFQYSTNNTSKASNTVTLTNLFFVVIAWNKRLQLSSLVLHFHNTRNYQILMNAIDAGRGHCYKHRAAVVIYMPAIALTMTERFLLIIILHGSSGTRLALSYSDGALQ